MAVTAAELIVLVRAEGVAETASALAGLSASADGAALGLGVLAIAGAATIGALGASVAAAASFQTTLQNVQNNTTMTTADLGVMREAVLQLGAATGAPLDNLATGFMKAMNITNDTAASMDILKIATESAVSTGGDAAATTSILANAMHEYGADVSTAATAQERQNEVLANATRYMNVFHLSAAEGNMTLSDFAASSGKSIGIAANLGVSVEDVSAAFATLTKHGFDAAQSGAQVTDMLTHMINPTKAQQKEIAKLSQATGVDLVADFSAAGLHGKGLAGVLGDVKEAYVKMGLSEAQAEQESMKLINAQRGGLGLAVLLGTGAEDYKNILADLTDQQKISTVTQEAFARSQETAGFQWNRLKVNIQEAAITLGTAMLPALTSVLQILTSGVGAVARFAAAHAALVAPIAAAIAGFTLLVAGVAVLGPLFTAVGAAIGAVVGVLMGPLGLALAAGALLVRAYATNWHGFGDAVRGAVDVTKAALAGLVAAFRTGDFNAAFGTIITAVDKAFGAEAAGKVTLFVSGALRGLQLFRDTIITVTQALRGEWVPSTAIQPFVNAVGIAVTALRNFVVGIVSGVGAVVDAFKKLHDGQITLAQFIGGMEIFVGTIAGLLGRLVGTIAADLGHLAQLAAPYLGQFFSAIGTAIQTYGPQVVAQFQIWAGRFSDWIQTTAIPFLAPRLQAFLSAVTTWITTTALPAIGTAALALGSALGTWITATAIPYLLTNLPLWLAALGGWISGTALPAITTAASQLGTVLGSWITTTAIPYLTTNLPLWSDALGSWITGTAVPAIVTKADELGKALSDWVATKAVPALEANLPGIASAIATGLTTALTNIDTFANDAGVRLNKWIKSEETQTKMAEVAAAVGTGLADILNNLDTFASTAGVRLHNFLSTEDGRTATLAWGSGLMSGLNDLNAQVEGWGVQLHFAIGDKFSEIGTTIHERIAQYLTDTGQQFSDLGTIIHDHIAQYVTDTGQQFSDMGTAIRDKLTTIKNDVGDAFSSLGTTVSDKMATVKSDVTTAFDGVITAASDAMARMKDAVSTGIETVVSTLGGLKDRAVGAVGDLSGALVGAGASLVQGFINGIESKIGAAQDAAGKLAGLVSGGITDHFQMKSPSRLMHGYGQNVAQGLTNGIASATPAAAKAAADLAVAVSKGITDTLAAMHLLSTYDFATGSPTGGQFAMLGTLTAQMVATIQDAAKGFTDAGLKAATTFADAAAKVGTMVKSALTGLQDLASYDFSKGTPTAEQMGMLTTLTVSLVQTIQDAATQFNDLGLKSATLFAEAAGKVGGMVKNALAGLSELANFDFAKNTPTGQQMGMLTTLVVSLVQTIEEAAVAFSEQGLKSATLFAESAGKVGGMVKNALAALSELANFDFAKNTPTGSAMGLFRQMITDVVLNIQEAATAFSDDGLKSATAFAESATKVMGLIVAGVGAFEKLSTFVAPPAAAIYAFGKALRAALNDLALVAEQVTQDAAASAAKFAESASKVVSMLGTGVAAFEKLTAFQAVPLAAVYAFGKALRATINDFALLAEQITPDATKAAALFAEGAGKVVGIIGAGVDGFSKLADFAAPASSAIYAFGKTLRAVINDLALVAEQVTQQATDSAAKFATGATTVLGVFGNGIAGLMDLAKFVAPSQKAIDDFAYAVGHLVERFANAARMIGEQGVAEAGKFGTAAKLAVDTIKVGLESFALFKHMVIPSAEAIDTLVAGVTYVVAKFRDMADQMGHDALTKAQAFGTAVEGTAKSIQTAIGTFKSLTEPPFKGAMTKIMTEFNADFDGSLNQMRDALDKAGQFETAANAYRDDMLRAASAIAAGNAALASAALPGNSLGRDMKAAGQNLGDALHDAVRETLQIKSPSQVMVAVGREVVNGLVQGLNENQAKAVAAAADAASKVAAAISATFDAMTKIGNFREASLTGLYALGKALRAAVNDFALIAEQVTPELAAAAGLFAEGAGKVVATIGAGADALTKLATYVDPPRAAIYAFGKALRLIVDDFALIAEQVTVEAATSAGLFAEGAGKVVGIIANGVAGFAALSGFVRPAESAIRDFVQATALLLRYFIAETAWMPAAWTDAAGRFAEGAGKVLGIVAQGVAGFAALPGAIRVPESAIRDFVQSAALLVRYFIAETAWMPAAWTDAAGRFAEGAGKVLGILTAGVAGLAALSNVIRVPEAAIRDFTADVALLVQYFITQTGWMLPAWLDAAGRFADTASKVVGIVAQGVAGFAALRGFTAPAEREIAAFAGAVDALMRRIGVVAATFDAGGLDAASKFADSAGKVVGIIGNGVTGLRDLLTFVSPAQSAMDAFANAVRAMMATLGAVAGTIATEGASAAATFAEAVGKVFAGLNAGTGFFKSLDGLLLPDQAGIDRILAPMLAVVSTLANASRALDAGALAGATALGSAFSSIFAGVQAGNQALGPVAAAGGGGGGGGAGGGVNVTIQINAPVYGVSDLQQAVVSAVIEAQRRGRL